MKPSAARASSISRPREGTTVAPLARPGRAARSRLGDYELLDLIGSGAMGRVYRAKHALLGRRVAVKVLRRELVADQAVCERFLAEARAVNLIGHPHIVDVIDFHQEEDGTRWLVMELLEGRDLAEAVAAGGLSLQRSLAIAAQICEALVSVHGAGIVHRDIKPANVFVVERAGEDFVKLLDFGIAQLPVGDVADGLTLRGTILGTPPYMAPEQARGDEVDHRGDLYAVGAILYELITGELLFSRRSLRELLFDVAYAEPPAASEHVELPAHVADDIDLLLRWCLGRQPAARPQSARELATVLRVLEARLKGAEGTGAPPRRRPSRQVDAKGERITEAAATRCARRKRRVGRASGSSECCPQP